MSNCICDQCGQAFRSMADVAKHRRGSDLDGIPDSRPDDDRRCLSATELQAAGWAKVDGAWTKPS